MDYKYIPQLSMGSLILITNPCPNFSGDLVKPLRWRHNEQDIVSNHQPHHCLLNRLFRRRSKKTSKLRVTGLCVGNSPGPVNSPHKAQLRGKCFHLMTSSWLCIHALYANSGKHINFQCPIDGRDVVWLMKSPHWQLLLHSYCSYANCTKLNEIIVPQYDVYWNIYTWKETNTYRW